MADSILRLKVESQEYDNKLKRAAEGIQRYAEQCRKAGGTLEHLDDGVEEFVRALGQMETVSKSAKGSVNELTKGFTELNVLYNKLTDVEKASPFGQALKVSLDELKGRIQAGNAEIKNINDSLNGSGGLAGALDQVAGKLGMNVKQLASWGAAIGAAKAALDVAKDAFFNSETSLDEWGRTVQSTESIYKGFLTALNNSDISGFLNRIDEIVSAARDAYNALDDLNTFTAFNQRNVAKGRANYAKALDEYKLNPTAENKQKLAQANQQVMNDLRDSHDKTEAAYQAALRQIATERIKDKGLQDAFVTMFMNKDYGEIQAAKASFKSGKGLNAGAQYYYGDRVYDGRVQDRGTGKWRNMTDLEKKQFEFARALSQVNDSQIKEVQALGAQSIAITEQIYQQDRAYNRLSGNNRRVGGTTPGTTSKSLNIAFDPNKAILSAEKGVDTMPSVWSMLGDQGLRDMLGIGAQQWDYNKVTKEATGEDIYKSLKEKDKETGKLTTELNKVGDKMSTFASGLSSIASGFKGLGVDLPKGVDEAINVIQSLCSIIQGVNTVISVFSASAITANTAAIAANTAALTANSVANIIPFAGGGIIPHAAGGTVAGTHFSGDVTPILANAGEVVLNKAETNNLATALTTNESGGNSGGRPYVDGETIYLGLNAYLKSTGRGEMMTSRFK